MLYVEIVLYLTCTSWDLLQTGCK